MGWGHLMRGCTVAESMPGDLTFVVGEGFDEARAIVRSRGIPAGVRRWSGPAPVASDLGDSQVAVIDSYVIDPGALAGKCPVVVFDDWVRTGITADGLVNANLGATRADYAGARASHWALGAGYALIRTEIRAAAAAGSEVDSETVLLTFGGSDPLGVTALVADRLRSTDWFADGGRLCVILGRSYQGATPWQSWPAADRTRCDVVTDPPDFVRRCASAMLIVVASGTTVYELAAMQKAFIPVAHTENNRRIARELAAVGIGAGLFAGEGPWLDRVAADVQGLAVDVEARHALGARARLLVDGNGVYRLKEFLSQVAG